MGTGSSLGKNQVNVGRFSDVSPTKLEGAKTNGDVSLSKHPPRRVPVGVLGERGAEGLMGLKYRGAVEIVLPLGAESSAVVSGV